LRFGMILLSQVIQRYLLREIISNCKYQRIFGFQAWNRTTPVSIERELQHTLIFSSDFPHFDAIFPGSVEAVTKSLDTSEQAKRKTFTTESTREKIPHEAAG
jgi:hypothetical protein